jgi:8-oxo-dGTP pyrophosphatase MutT (NUDIX family)
VIDQAGAIAIRRGSGDPYVLLVRARKDPAAWIFPKGHVEPGESSGDAALRELAEEAGVGGVLGDRAGVTIFSDDDHTYRVEYFVVDALEEHASWEGRERRWCSLDEAFALLTHGDARDHLKRILPTLTST